jgi:hypothetical protein
MHITWYLKKIDTNQSRVGFVVWTNPTVNIPKWLFNWAARKMVPRFIADLENKVKTTSRSHHLQRPDRRVAATGTDE